MTKTMKEWKRIVRDLECKHQEYENENESDQRSWCWDVIEAIETQRVGQPPDAVDIDLTDLAIKQAMSS